MPFLLGAVQEDRPGNICIVNRICLLKASSAECELFHLLGKMLFEAPGYPSSRYGFGLGLCQVENLGDRS
jgi:hypothetical protein